MKNKYANIHTYLLCYIARKTEMGSERQAGRERSVEVLFPCVLWMFLHIFIINTLCIIHIYLFLF